MILERIERHLPKTDDATDGQKLESPVVFMRSDNFINGRRKSRRRKTLSSADEVSSAHESYKSTSLSNFRLSAASSVLANKEKMSLPVEDLPLFVPPPEEITNVLTNGLRKNYETVEVEYVDCPDLTKEPFTLAAKGLSGKPILVEIGGQSNIFPVANKEKIYDLVNVGKLLNIEPAFMLGASAGPYTSVNTELMVNLIIEKGKAKNKSHISSINRKNGNCHLEQLADNETRCALLANLFCCQGKPGKVLQISCKKRIGKDNFPASIRKTLQEYYKEKAVALGGAFLLKSGKAKQHIMPDFSIPLYTDEQIANWFHYYDMSAPLVAVGTITSVDPGLGLRLQHFHSFSHHGEGGHYHIDTEPHEADYLGYFSLCEHAYRVDRPEDTGRKGVD